MKLLARSLAVLNLPPQAYGPIYDDWVAETLTRRQMSRLGHDLETARAIHTWVIERRLIQMNWLIVDHSRDPELASEPLLQMI